MSRADLPNSLPPRGLNRPVSAAYVGVGTSLFDEMVGDGRMPKPKTINTRVLWDRWELDLSFDALPHKDEANPWDQDTGGTK